MNIAGVDVPLWVFDWTGSLAVVVSLVYLARQELPYWHWSNASLAPYFVLFVASDQYMLAGLQLCYLVFGIHGLLLWRLEHRRDQGGRPFAERWWYRAGWVMTLAIFGYTVAVSSFPDAWARLQFAIVSLALVANWATTRRRLWSWNLWVAVNALQAIYFAHLGLWAQFGLQFVLAAMSVRGALAWRTGRLGDTDSGVAAGREDLADAAV